MLRTSAFESRDCGRFLLRLTDCSNRPDDRPDFPFDCLHVLSENPSSNPAVYCRPWFSPCMFCCTADPVSGLRHGLSIQTLLYSHAKKTVKPYSESPTRILKADLAMLPWFS